VSENRARPLVTAVPGDRPESLSRVDAWRSWAGRQVVLVDARMDRQWIGQACPPEHTLEGALQRSSVDGCGHDRPWTPVADMDVAVRRGVRCGHHCPEARPHHGSVAHSGNRRPSGWTARGDSGHELGRRVPPARSAGTLHGWRWSGAPATRPLLTREEPSVAGATGTRRARPARTNLPSVGCRWPQLGRRARLVRGDHLPQWRGRHAHGSRWGEGLEPAVLRLNCSGPRREGAMTWDACIPAVTARARREPPVPHAVRTQHGPA
jgi:hypothetical protein